MENEKKINNPLDAAICDMVSTFAIEQVEKMAKGTFTAEDFKVKLEDTAIGIRNLFMQLRKANMI